MRVQHRKQEGDYKENSGEPTGDTGQNVGRLRSKNVFRYPAAEGRAQTFALRTLHEDEQDHQQAREDIEAKQEVNQNSHGARNIVELGRL